MTEAALSGRLRGAGDVLQGFHGTMEERYAYLCRNGPPCRRCDNTDDRKMELRDGHGGVDARMVCGCGYETKWFWDGYTAFDHHSGGFISEGLPDGGG